MSSQRVPIVGGNWKMHTDRASARALAEEVVAGTAGGGAADGCEIVLFPPFPYLECVGDVARGSSVKLGAQDVFYEPDGAFTGEVSAAMLRDLGCSHVIVGHSERRHVIEPGENDKLINRKLTAALKAGLVAILCVGEKLEQRESEETEQVVLQQLAAGLDGVDERSLSRVVIAYEPVWAIGTGRTATPEDAQQVHGALRQAVASRYNVPAAESIRIQYGGSVKAGNAAQLFSQPDVDGFLVGGASLKGEEFLSIVRAAAEN